MAIASLFSKIAFDAAEIFRRSLPIISGAATIAKIAIWVCSSAVVRQPLPIKSMSGVSTVRQRYYESHSFNLT
jgi:hypothetical protein